MSERTPESILGAVANEVDHVVTVLAGADTPSREWCNLSNWVTKEIREALALLRAREEEHAKLFRELNRLSDESLEAKAQTLELAALRERVGHLTANERAFLDMTRRLQEHPEGYDGPCECETCQSYGDE